jgi:hypothetical protein
LDSKAHPRSHAGAWEPEIHNLEQAEYWYQQSLELTSENDQKGRGGCLAQLGLVAYERFKETRAISPNRYYCSISMKQLNIIRTH